MKFRLQRRSGPSSSVLPETYPTLERAKKEALDEVDSRGPGTTMDVVEESPTGDLSERLGRAFYGRDGPEWTQ